MWLVSLAWAGTPVASVLSASCPTAEAALPFARAYFEAEGGLPAGAVAIGLVDAVMCCGGPQVTVVDADGRPLPGSLALNGDCTLLGVSPAPGPPPQRVVKIEGPPGPLPNGASALKSAAEALRGRTRTDPDLVVAVPARAGWEVWLVRDWGYDVLTVARVTVGADGGVTGVVDDVREWVPPAEAVAARTLRSLAP